MDFNPLDYAALIFHSPTPTHVNASQRLKHSTSALLQKSPTSATAIYHQTLQFKTVFLSAAKVTKLCLPCVHKCPLTNFPALSQPCLPCLAERGVMFQRGAPLGPARQRCPWVWAGAEPFPKARVEALLVLYSAVHSIPRYILDFFLTARFDWGWRKEHKKIT